jgi:lipid-A-disaccharide synthase
MIVAGEASGDLHGAALARALRGLAPSRRLFGMGGRNMAAAGVELLADVTAAAVVGSSEVLGRLPALYRTYRRLCAALATDRPVVLVAIDCPGFNMRLARVACHAGIPVVYFIPPQIWAWRAGRARTIRRRVSLVLAVFPFEVAIYRGAGVSVEWVGHPLVDTVTTAPSREAARIALGVAASETVVGLLPGSRRDEVDRMLPVMCDAIVRARRRLPGVRVLAAAASTVEAGLIKRHLDGVGDARVVHDATHAVVRAADAVLVTSGTATLETALLGTPMVVAYRVSLASDLLVRGLVRVPWMSLVNIVLGRGLVPELYQEQMTGERMGRELTHLLGDPAARQAQRQGFSELAAELGRPGVAERAAHHVLRLVEKPAMDGRER